MQPHINVTVRSQKRVTDFWDAGEQTVFDSVNPCVGNMKDTSVSEQPSGGDQRELQQYERGVDRVTKTTIALLRQTTGEV